MWSDCRRTAKSQQDQLIDGPSQGGHGLSTQADHPMHSADAVGTTQRDEGKEILLTNLCNRNAQELEGAQQPAQSQSHLLGWRGRQAKTCCLQANVALRSSLDETHRSISTGTCLDAHRYLPLQKWFILLTVT